MDIINTIIKTPLHYVLYDIMFSHTPRKRPLVKNEYAALCWLVVTIFSGWLNEECMWGIACAGWLFIPCGIKIVNTNRWLWFGRQTICVYVVYHSM